MVKFTIETDRETDGRWIAEVVELPGVMIYGKTKPEAVRKVKALARREIALRIERDEAVPGLDLTFKQRAA